MNKLFSALAFAVLAAAPALAAPAEAPMFFTQLKPKVGAWAEYSIVTKKGDKLESQGKFRAAIVGKTAEGVWLEERMTLEIPKPRHPDEDVTMKILMSRDRILKAYMKTSHGVTDMSAMMTRSSEKAQATVAAAKRTEVGSETIEVPAGKFKTTHYSVAHEKGATDMWIKSGTGPWGMIKQVHAGDHGVSTIELLASGVGAKSEVDETTARAFPSMSAGMGMNRPSQPKGDASSDDSGSAPAATPSAGSVIGNALKSHFGL